MNMIAIQRTYLELFNDARRIVDPSHERQYISHLSCGDDDYHKRRCARLFRRLIHETINMYISIMMAEMAINGNQWQ